MHLVLCLDQHNGLLFHNRRQSRDRAVWTDIASYLNGKKLWMDSYTAVQLTEEMPNLQVSDTYAAEAAEEDYCFAERGDTAALVEKAKSVMIYRWDKLYPADIRLCPDIFQAFSLAQKTEFKGFSHDKITREVYIREEK